MQNLLRVPSVQSVKTLSFVLRICLYLYRTVYLLFYEQILSQKSKAQKLATRHEVIQYDGVRESKREYISEYIRRTSQLRK